MEVSTISSSDAAACNNNGLGKDVLYDSARFSIRLLWYHSSG
jgi:hypothetical protein